MSEGTEAGAEHGSADPTSGGLEAVEGLIRELGAALRRELDEVRGELRAQAETLRRHVEESDALEISRVNGVHGRVDATRAEFLEGVTRLTEHVGESHHRMSLITAEVQRATELFDLKLSALEAQTERGLQAVGRILFDREAGAGAGPDQDGSRKGSERESA